jgi:hypothetical protein
MREKRNKLVALKRGSSKYVGHTHILDLAAHCGLASVGPVYIARQKGSWLVDCRHNAVRGDGRVQTDLFLGLVLRSAFVAGSILLLPFFAGL